MSISCRRFHPDSGWLLGVEYDYQSRHSRYLFLDQDGQLLDAKKQTKSLTFATAEEPSDFFDHWLKRKQLAIKTLDLPRLVEVAQENYDPAAVR